jgi:hypothetical protein
MFSLVFSLWGAVFVHADSPWTRDVGDYIALRTVRMGFPSDTNSKITTNGKRYDLSIGNRIPLKSWSQVFSAEGWAAGIDGGMMASLERFNRNGNLTFATNTFDGYFGGWIAYAGDGFIIMIRSAHLSAHLVDNSPDILNAVNYSQFWNELILTKSFPDPIIEANWELHFQGNFGINHTSFPKSKNPRTGFGISGGYSPWGPQGLALLASADVLKTGVQRQSATSAFFLGIGRLTRPQTIGRPFRVGIAVYRGSDARNQYFFERQKWAALEISTDL